MYNIASEHLVIVRTGGSVINIDSYNCQEIGLAKALTEKGLKVSLILAGKTNSVKIIHVNDKKINVYFIKYFGINQALSWFIGLDKLLMNLNPTCLQIHEFGMLMSYRVLKWAQKYNKRIYLIQGSYSPTKKFFLKYLELFFNKTFGTYILNHVNGIGCKSKMAADYVHIYTCRQTINTYIGLDVEKFKLYKDINWKKQLKLQDNSRILLYIGTLEKRRNPDKLLDILFTLPDNYILVLAGNGPMYSYLMKKIKELRLEQRCFLLGKLHQDVLPSLYKMSDIFTLISDYEIYGMVILESMYFGVPVISTKTAGSEVLIENGSDGIIINTKSIEYWKRAIINVTSDMKTLSVMRQKAKNKIKSKYLWVKASEQFLELYQIS